MTTIRALITRTSQYCQDEDHSAWSYAAKRARLMESIAQLARQQLFGNIAWRQGVADTPQYPFDDTTVDFAEVIYNGRSLRPVSEQSLTTYQRRWESRSGQPPLVWTSELQAPQTVRLVPTPLATGSAVPQIPAVPLVETEVLNVLSFLWEMPQDMLAGDDTDIALPAVLEDPLVWQTVSLLTGQNGEYQDPSKSTTFGQLAQMVTDTLMVEP